MVVQVKIDAKAALARFSPSGIPVAVRNNLRRVLPDLMRDVSAAVDTNLSALKSRTHVQIKGGQGQLVENANQITGKIEMIWTGDPKASMVPQILESGARPHVIAAKNVNALSFYWPVLAKQVFFKHVNHPGFPGIKYMQRAFAGMKDEITTKITKAVDEAMKQK